MYIYIHIRYMSSATGKHRWCRIHIFAARCGLWCRMAPSRYGSTPSSRGGFCGASSRGCSASASAGARQQRRWRQQWRLCVASAALSGTAAFALADVYSTAAFALAGLSSTAGAALSSTAGEEEPAAQPVPGAAVRLLPPATIEIDQTSNEIEMVKVRRCMTS